MENALWYFTFGLGHPFSGFILPIRGSYGAAREVMESAFGYHWANQYTETDGQHTTTAYYQSCLRRVMRSERIHALHPLRHPSQYWQSGRLLPQTQGGYHCPAAKAEAMPS